MSRTSSCFSRFAAVAAVGALAVAVTGGTLPAVADAATHLSAAATPSLAGTWNVQGGIFKFAKNHKGQFVDTVVKQRPEAICLNVNDKNGQIVLTQQRQNPREYKGTWKWFFSGTCASAGNGPTTIILSANGKTARFVSDPPSGIGGTVEIFTITRVG
jgi:hypothetical protein